MPALDTASLPDEPALSGWWVGICLSIAGLVLLFAALIQQASRLSETLITLTGGQSAQIGSLPSEPFSAEQAEQGVLVSPVDVTANTPEPSAIPIEEVSPVSGAQERPLPSASNDWVSDVETGNLATSLEAEDLVSPDRPDQPDLQDQLAQPNQLGEPDVSLKNFEQLLATSTRANAELDIDTSLVSDVEPVTDANFSSDAGPISDGDVNLDPPVSVTGNLASADLSSNAALDDAQTDDLSGASAVTDEVLSNASAESDELLSDASSTTDELLSDATTQEQAEGSTLSLASLRRDVLTNMTRRSNQIAFAAGTSELTPSSEQLLTQTFEDLFLYAESNITIEVGSLDGLDDTANQALSSERALTIQTFLVERGLEEERLIISLPPNAVQSNQLQHVNIQANL